MVAVLIKFVFALTLVTPLVLLGQELPTGDSKQLEVKSPKKLSKKVQTNSSFFLASGDLKSYRYQEPGVVEHEGYMYGVDLGFSKKFDRTTFNLKLNWSEAEVNYSGSLCDTNFTNCQPYKTTTQDRIIKINAAMAFDISPKFQAYVGGGFRYLTDKLNGVGSYLRTGQWWFIPLGTKYVFDISEDVSWSILGEFDWIVSGGINSNLSEISLQYSDLFLSQSGSGTSIEVAGHFQNIKASLYFDTWRLNRSDPGVSGGQSFTEPANQTTEFGGRLGYIYHF